MKIVLCVILETGGDGVGSGRSWVKEWGREDHKTTVYEVIKDLMIKNYF